MFEVFVQHYSERSRVVWTTSKEREREGGEEEEWDEKVKKEGGKG